MLPDEILRLRLSNQHLAAPHLSDPAQLVAQLGAIQAQDYGSAKWALGQRLEGAADDSIERAFAAGAILRTHVLRPTWHFVTPADIRWLLALTAPRVKAFMAYNDRKLGIDDALVTRSNAAIARALEGGKHLTRAELDAALRQAGIAAKDGQTLGHLVMRAELDAIVCSGPRRSKQFTYALLDERVPSALSAPAAHLLDRDAALAELTWRYVASHGPATVHDLAWWSGLTVTDVTRGLELNGPRLTRETAGGLTYWFTPAATAASAEPTASAASQVSEVVHLLPNYDEYTVAYKDRDLYFAPPSSRTPTGRDDVPFSNVILIAGRVAGYWTRTLRKGTVVIEPRWFEAPSEPHRLAIAAAARRYGAFLGLRAELAE